MEDEDMKATWQAAHTRINEQRIKRGMTWEQVETIGKVSQRTRYKIRDDGIPLQSAAKRASLSLAIGWEADGLDCVLRGDEPRERKEPLEVEPPAQVNPSSDDLQNRLSRVEAALSVAIKRASGLDAKRAEVLDGLVTRLEAIEEQLREQA